MKRLTYILSLLICMPLWGVAQTADWSFSVLDKNVENTREFSVQMEISIPDEFHMYSFDQAEGGPIAAHVEFNLPQGIEKVGGITCVSAQPEEFFDDIFGIQIRQFSHKTTWQQRFRITQNSAEARQITGKYSYQLCKDDGYCLNPFPEEFSVTVPHGIQFKEPEIPRLLSENQQVIVDTNAIEPPKPDSAQIAVENLPEPTQAIEEPITENRSLVVIFLLGFLGGILAFLTPCVFPMVPMTVSMFLKRNRQHALRDVLVYGFSIVFIFVTLGLCLTLILGVDALNKLSTEPAFNMVFFVIFVIFAVSFFGVFELMLPAGLINYFDRKADNSKGFLSIFFMAFTLVLVSFSCTAMIIGTLLVESVVSGSIVGPLMGMTGFAVALALPFVVFAAVPSLLSGLGKSGEWMNDIKLSLGFIELGFALKFISKADLVAGWGILSRDLFIAFWIVFFVLWGLCILRVIRLNGSTKKPLSKARICVATIIFACAVALIPGFLGKPIDLISGYLPPMSTQKIHVLSPKVEISDAQKQKKYADLFHSPYGIEGFYDYDEGMAYAVEVQKPVLLDFTGLGCENCRKIEMNVWGTNEVLEILKNDYVLISLYLDSREPLDSSLVRYETYGNKTYHITTLGEHWSIFMMKNYHGLMQPYYVLLSPNGEQLTAPITYNEAKNVNDYVAFLKQGLEKFCCKK